MNTEIQTIITQKRSSGQFNIIVYKNNNTQFEFETTDSQLIDDINTLTNNYNEKELCMFDSFEELLKYCLNKECNLVIEKK